MKSSRPGLRIREPRDKRPLGKDTDRSWYHRHNTSIFKLFTWQPVDSWTERQHIRMLLPISMDPWAAIKKVLHYCEGDTSSCPGPYPTAFCPKFHVG